MPNILIHPNSGIIEFSTGIAGGSSFNPNFTGGANAVRLSYDNIGGLNITNYSTGLASGIDRFSVDGVNGRLFSVTDNLSGSLFSVNDIAGLPIIEAFDDNTVIMGAFNRNDFVLTGNSLGLGGLPNTGNTKLYVSGNIRTDGNIFISGNPVLTGITDANWASQTELDSTGIALVNRISSLSGSLGSSGIALTNTINSLSGSLNLSGINLINWTNSLSGSLNSTGINLLNRINSLSGYINSTSSNIVFTTGNQNIGGNKTFTGITTFSGQEINLVDTALNLSGVGDMTFSGTNINFINSPVYISGTNLRVDGNILLSGNPVLTGIPDGSWATQNELDATGIALVNRISSLSGSLNSSGIDLTNTINSLSGSLNSSGINLINWTNSLSGSLNSSGISLINTIASLSGNVVLLTGNQTIAGTKTFSNTGVFNTLSINDNKLTSYAYHTNNFTFNNYINIVNSSSLITGTLQDPVQSGINYYIKNLNTGILLITGASNRLIDGYSFVNLYKNESLNIMGVSNIGYTGWVTLSLGGGVS